MVGIDFDGCINKDWKWIGMFNVCWEDKQFGFNNNISWYGLCMIMNLCVGVESEIYVILVYVNNLINDYMLEIVLVNVWLSDFGGDFDGYLLVGC